MGEHPTIALLESTHTFPGPYLFKVIGKTDLGFVARTVAAVRDGRVENEDIVASAAGQRIRSQLLCLAARRSKPWLVHR